MPTRGYMKKYCCSRLSFGCLSVARGRSTQAVRGLLFARSIGLRVGRGVEGSTGCVSFFHFILFTDKDSEDMGGNMRLSLMWKHYLPRRARTW